MAEDSKQPVHHWSFCESPAEKSIRNLGSSDVEGKLVCGATVKDGWVCLSGANECCVQFPAEVAAFEKRDFTISFYIKNSENSIPLFDLFGNREAGSHGNFISFRMTGAHQTSGHGVVSLEVDDHGNKKYAAMSSKDSKSSLNDGKPHHIAGVRSGKTVTLYVDGENVGSQTTQEVISVHRNTPFRLGRSLSRYLSGRFSPKGEFGELMIFGRPLTEEEVKDLCQTSLPGGSLSIKPAKR